MNHWHVVNTITKALKKEGYSVDVVLAEDLHAEEIQLRLRIKSEEGRAMEFLTKEKYHG